MIESHAVQREVQRFIDRIGRAMAETQFRLPECTRAPADKICQGVEISTNCLECFHGFSSHRVGIINEMHGRHLSVA